MIYSCVYTVGLNMVQNISSLCNIAYCDHLLVKSILVRLVQRILRHEGVLYCTIFWKMYPFLSLFRKVTLKILEKPQIVTPHVWQIELPSHYERLNTSHCPKSNTLLSARQTWQKPVEVCCKFTTICPFQCFFSSLKVSEWTSWLINLIFSDVAGICIPLFWTWPLCAPWKKVKLSQKPIICLLK